MVARRRQSSLRTRGRPEHDAKRLTLRKQWIAYCLQIAHDPATFYSGCRKIVHPVRLVFHSLDQSLTLRDAGYTKSKLTALTRHYLHHESRDVAIRLWLKRKEQAKYGSVAFTCFAHFEKGDVTGATPRGSVFGPCIQSVVISWVDREHYRVDAYWRTTELFKKFAPDLILLRDVLLQPFDFTGMQLTTLTCHFANVTAHPMYWATLLPHFPDPVLATKSIKEKYFRNWLIKWTARYICPEYHRGIAKFSQALRVQKDVKERMTPAALRKMQKYVKQNHPGYRTEKANVEEED